MNNIIKNSRFWLKKTDILLLCFLSIFFLSNVVDKQIRHFFYLLPILAIFFTGNPFRFFRRIRFGEKQEPILKHFFFLNLGLIIYSGLILLCRQDFFSRFFEEAVFIISPIIFVYCFWLLSNREDVSRYAKIIFWGITISYLTAIHDSIYLLFKQENFFDNSILLSQLPTEHLSSFLFGLCCLYFLHKRDWFYYLVSLSLTIVSFKRIAIAGVIVSSIVWFVMPWLKGLFKKKILVISLLLVLNASFVALMLLLSSLKYDKEIIQFTGISTQGLSTGRTKTFTAVLEEVDGLSFWGYGLGKSSQILTEKQHYLSLIHSDIMKLVVELGILGGILWLAFFYWPFLANPSLLFYSVYLNFLFFTDNTLIYFEVLALFYFLIILSKTDNETVSST